MLRAIKSNDHKALFSLSTENDQSFFSMVSDDGNYVKMESWKFLKLLESSDTAFRLHEFVKRKVNTPDAPFEFSSNKEGFVFGKFNAEYSYIDLGCFLDADANPKGLKHKATFFVDTNYVLCLYSILKRLDDDREQFKRQLDQAKSIMPVKDPFELIHSALLIEQLRSVEKQPSNSSE